MQTFLGFIPRRTETAITTYGATRSSNTRRVTRKTSVKKFEDGNGVWAGSNLQQ